MSKEKGRSENYYPFLFLSIEKRCVYIPHDI